MKDTSQSVLRLSTTAIRGGVWEGVATTNAVDGVAPGIELWHQGAKVCDARAEAVSGSGSGTSWRVSVAVPPEQLSDGVHTFSLVEAESGLALNSFVVSLGEALDADLRAEVDQLRAELDLLKRAFRRHCADG